MLYPGKHFLLEDFQIENKRISHILYALCFSACFVLFSFILFVLNFHEQHLIVFLPPIVFTISKYSLRFSISIVFAFLSVSVAEMKDMIPENQEERKYILRNYEGALSKHLIDSYNNEYKKCLNQLNWTFATTFFLFIQTFSYAMSWCMISNLDATGRAHFLYQLIFIHIILLVYFFARTTFSYINLRKKWYKVFEEAANESKNPILKFLINDKI